MTITTRFAPSPTGRLHVGNIRTALHNWLLAKKHGGRFLLRIDDTDAERSREEYVDAIRADLAWLGLVPDGEERQSQRLAIYEAAFERLVQRRADLSLLRNRAGAGPQAQGAARPRPAADLRPRGAGAERCRPCRESSGRASPRTGASCSTATTPIAWEDGIRGPQHFDPALLSDPVIRRADGSWLYMLPSAIDDIEMGITDVLRGEDHVSNTAVQIQMFTALYAAGIGRRIRCLASRMRRCWWAAKASFPSGSDRWAWMPSASAGSSPKRSWRCWRGWARRSRSNRLRIARVLIESFDLATFGRAPARFDEEELERLNAGIVHQLPFERVRASLPDGMDAAGWDAIRPNLAHIGEAAQWWQVVTGPIEQPAFDEETKAYLAQAALLLSWGEDPWHALTGALKEATGRKGKALFLPLRQALTGLDHGPEMAALLPLIGETEARARLERAAGG